MLTGSKDEGIAAIATNNEFIPVDWFGVDVSHTLPPFVHLWAKFGLCRICAAILFEQAFPESLPGTLCGRSRRSTGNFHHQPRFISGFAHGLSYISSSAENNLASGIPSASANALRAAGQGSRLPRSQSEITQAGTCARYASFVWLRFRASLLLRSLVSIILVTLS